MSLSNYAELKASIADWMHRKDLNARIPDFIKLAETRMNAEIRSRELEVSVPVLASANNATIDLPTDMVEMRRLMLVGDCQSVLQYRSPDSLSAHYGNAATGLPSAFTVIGNKLQFGPIPDANYELELVYQRRLIPLSDADPTNWILTKYPDAYLYGALLAAQPFTQEDNRGTVFAQLYNVAITNINTVDWYSGSTLQVRAN